MENKHLLKYTNIKKYWLSYLYMEECFRCGATKDETRLFDAIADEGVVKACRDCIKRESLPTIRKPSLDQLKESEDRISVREKLSMMAGVESKTDSQGNKGYVRTSSDKSKNEYNLNDIIERNLERRKLSKRKMEKLPPEKELVENFHWVVMRARRFKKISQEQLGKEIGESETAVNMVENGELPEDFERLIKKLEAYLRVRLFKNQEKKKPSQAEVSFDPYSTKTTTVGDLKEEEEKQKSEVSGESRGEDSEDVEDDSDEEEYPEKNKTRRSKLWNLFRKKARKAQNDETESEEENEENTGENNDNTVEEIDDTEGLYYDDLEDYSYQDYEKPEPDKNKKEEQERDFSQVQETEKSKTDQSHEKRYRDFKTRKETTDKDKEEKKDKDKDDLSQKDIDDLIFRKS